MTKQNRAVSMVLLAVLFTALGYLVARAQTELHLSSNTRASLSVPAAKETEIRRRYPSPPAELREQLTSLPYVLGTRDDRPEDRGVLIYDAGRSLDGLNFFNSVFSQTVQLMDNSGREIHRWKLPGPGYWHHVELLPDGSILATREWDTVVRLDKRSRVQWTYAATGVHHDLSVLADRVYLLQYRTEQDRAIHPSLPILVDDAVVLDLATGDELERFSLFELVAKSQFAHLIPRVPADGTYLYRHTFDESKNDSRPLGIDIFHTNHIEALDGAAMRHWPLAARGNVLLSFRELNTIVVADLRKQAILWAWGPNTLLYQHDPSLTQHGTVLVFDNRAERSRVIEIEPATGQIVWQFGPRDGFFSARRGSAQRLRNGNTLITESDKGYVFEVTPNGETVWRFANPEIDSGGVRRAIWRLRRFTREELPFLQSGHKPEPAKD